MRETVCKFNSHACIQMKRIVITGPESSGKTTLVGQLAQHLKTPAVEEYAREFLNQLQRPYTEADLLEIAKGQWAQEQAFENSNREMLILDTSLEVIKIWSEVRFQRVDPWILEILQKDKKDFYLLCQPDLPWEFDPLRENPRDRWLLYELYENELKSMKVPFATVSGFGEQRFINAFEKLHNFLQP